MAIAMRAVLIDVGGTLWPNTWPVLARDHDERAARVHGASPTLTEPQVARLVTELAALDHPDSQRQQTESLVHDTLSRVAPKAAVPVRSIVDAMCLPARNRVEPFAGAPDLLAGLGGRGVRVIIVSNTMWRAKPAQHRDLEDFGLSSFVADCVMSLDVGWRKPHAAFFDAALAAAECRPGECAMVGDSEVNDIAPAQARGMFSVRVAIEEPFPSPTAAPHVAGSLGEIADILGDLPWRKGT